MLINMDKREIEQILYDLHKDKSNPCPDGFVIVFFLI